MAVLLGPVLKWVGGKRQLLDEILPIIKRERPSTYIEPFLGGGAVLFALHPKKAIVNDSNGELINVYEVIRDSVDELVEVLREHQKRNSEDYYYKIRGLDRTPEYHNMTKVERAARILYLNKTCYNGLFRVNAAGQFNSPFGKYKNPNIINEFVLKAVSTYFNSNDIRLFHGDYRNILRRVRRGQFVYLDPPYMPISTSSSFTGYTDKGFDFDEQKALKSECDKLREKGVSFLQSNSDCDEIRQLYSDYEIFSVKAKRAINSVAKKRGEINEVLIYYGKGQKGTKS